jgi:hypothetical protein
MEHLALDLIFHLADSGEHHPHLDHCAHCREQVRAARDFHTFLDDRSSAEAEPERTSQTRRGTHVLRLAAQTLPTTADTLVRRTWYVEGMDLLVRVVESRTKDRLTGFVIAEPSLYPHVTVTFSGLPDAFHPDAHGRFDIGPAELDIDPMQVEIVIEDADCTDASHGSDASDDGPAPAPAA